MAESPDQSGIGASDHFKTLIGWILAAEIVAMALFVSPTGSSVFRLPKDILLMGSAIVLATVYLSGMILESVKLGWIPWRSGPVRLAGGIIVWSLIATATSTQPRLSLASARLAIAAAILFVVTYSFVSRHREPDRAISPFALAGLLIAGAIVNGAIAMAQAFSPWSPIELEVRLSRHFVSRTALIGNPNDVGMFLVVPALAAVVLASVSRGRKRWILGGIAIFLFGALVTNQTRTAVIAYLTGIFLVGIVGAGRRGVVWVAIPVGIILILAMLSPAFFRVEGLRSAFRSGSIDRILSGRLIAFGTASAIFLDHPLLGSGPGTFGWQYLPYRAAAVDRWESLERAGTRNVNFAEVHNDHLEVLAETGIPGYALFLGSLALIASVSIRAKRPGAGPSRIHLFAGGFALPFAGTVFVLCLAQFPLQLAAPTSTLVMFAAICLGWREDR